ncbi:putative glycerol-1-phosphate prenyltransferase [Flavobacterium sp. 7E]|uniref:geranylgeranylglyceryl/heptaprenylglyceryl phosphate synthase n=1 Tax=unclassified Flavobacterium TaxID=196869 RepID=UPI00156D432D|nr:MULTISPECIES: geranylgeranylglyceryl/heptaprenylglyceryl phosphate synthase [unclassified Flavobacterium]MBE0390746.1 Geranylgeranylglyceryl phosphate synthase [Flavobacterium sp. PL002]NRS87226.1 putative glycerol-1-phosphate prenyltransferase [Flavobacterium sp. 7E]
MQNNNKIYQEILNCKANKKKLLAILLDPDKIVWESLDNLIHKIINSPATHVFIGGSLVTSNRINELIIRLKQKVNLPIVLFPGNPSQISNEADGILFLSLLSGRNPDYLIGHQVKAAPILYKSKLEIVPTGYLLISGGSTTAVEYVSKTNPIDRADAELALATALAGEMMGNKLIYLEAGSGAQQAVPENIIELVSRNLTIPLIVGGGIVDLQGIKKAYDSGADLVVIGTAFEKDIHFFDTNKNLE